MALSGEQPEELSYLFVMTYGRSGSTLLLGILNSIPGYLIRGENGDVLRHLFAFDRAASGHRADLRRRQRRSGLVPGGSTTTHPWYGMDAFPVHKSRRLLRQLANATLFRPDQGTRVTGCKEIRWSGAELAEYVGWLRQVFPGARFLVNTRSLDDVARSMWWADRPQASEELRRRESEILEVSATLGDSAHRVRYDAYVNRPEALTPMFDWLGEEMDLDRLRTVMTVRHSY